MDKIPTAEELLREICYQWRDIVNNFEKEGLGLPDPRRVLIDASDAINLAKILSKLHVKAALEAASNPATAKHCNHLYGAYCECPAEFDEESILNAYPESNIK